MGPKIILLLFLVAVLGVVIYLFRSGIVSSGLAELGNGFHFPTSTYTLTPPSGDSYPSSASVPPSVPVSVPAPVATNTNPINPADVPTGFTLAQLSPYFQEVRFGGLSAGANGEIVLDANLEQGQGPVDITGWKIVTNDSGEYIPQAVNLYDPSGLTPPSDIILTGSQYVYLYSSPGPVNLRINECIGYLAAEFKVTPALPEDCPSVDFSLLSSLSGECQNFIESIGNCQTPNLNNAPISNDDYACRDYIEDNFTYSSCFSAYKSDANFLSNQYWVWMGASPLDQYHDHVYLYDRNGLLVDEDSY